MHMLFIFSRIVDYAYELPYYFEPVSVVYLQMNIIHFAISVVNIVLDFNIITDSVDASLIFLLLIPPAFMFGRTFRRYLILNIELIK